MAGIGWQSPQDGPYITPHLANFQDPWLLATPCGFGGFRRPSLGSNLSCHWLPFNQATVVALKGGEHGTPSLTHRSGQSLEVGHLDMVKVVDGPKEESEVLNTCWNSHGSGTWPLGRAFPSTNHGGFPLRP